MAFAARKQFLERARTRQSPADFSEITHEEIENEFDSYTTNQITMLAESTTSSEKLFQFLRTTKPSKENLSSLQIRRELDGLDQRFVFNTKNSPEQSDAIFSWFSDFEELCVFPASLKRSKGSKEAGSTGPVPRAIAQCIKLRKIDMSVKSRNANSRTFSGPFPVFLVDLPLLEELDLSGNKFDCEIPLRFLRWMIPRHGPYSRKIRLSDIEPGFTLPVNIGDLGSEFDAINLHYVSLTGSLPESIGRLTSVKELQFDSGSNFKGPLPESIGNLTNLTSLHLYGTGFTGPLPESLANLTNLKRLDLRENNFDPRPGAKGNNEWIRATFNIHPLCD